MVVVQPTLSLQNATLKMLDSFAKAASQQQQYRLADFIMLMPPAYVELTRQIQSGEEVGVRMRDALLTLFQGEKDNSKEKGKGQMKGEKITRELDQVKW